MVTINSKIQATYGKRKIQMTDEHRTRDTRLFFVFFAFFFVYVLREAYDQRLTLKLKLLMVNEGDK